MLGCANSNPGCGPRCQLSWSVWASAGTTPQARVRASSPQKVITWPTDLNTDPGSSKATDPHMALGCSLGFNVSMASGSSSDHSDQYGPSSSMPLRHHHSHGHLHSPPKYHGPWTSTQTWFVVGPQIQTTSHEPQVTAPISQFLSNVVSSVLLSPLGSNHSATS